MSGTKENCENRGCLTEEEEIAMSFEYGISELTGEQFDRIVEAWIEADKELVRREMEELSKIYPDVGYRDHSH